MNTNKAPDKMYLNLPNPEEGGDFFPYWTENAEKADNVISEEYLRKDALLELINTSKNSLLMDTKAPHLGKVGSLATLDALTDILNSM